MSTLGPSAKAASVFRSDSEYLRRGSIGERVKELQTLLNRNLQPSPGLVVDGVFGPLTEEAVLHYQSLHGLEVDGVVGPKTWESLTGGQAGGAGKPNVPTQPKAPKKAPTISSAPGGGAQPAWLELAIQEWKTWEAHSGDENWRERKRLEYCAAIHMGYNDWCSAFVNWVMQRSMKVNGTMNGYAASWVAWAGGRLGPPRRGAIAIRRGYHGEIGTWNDWSHVAFLYDWKGGQEQLVRDQYAKANGGRDLIPIYKGITVRLLGGNQGGVWHGEVNLSNAYTPDFGLAFVWPAWLS